MCQHAHLKALFNWVEKNIFQKLIEYLVKPRKNTLKDTKCRCFKLPTLKCRL